MRQVVSFTLSAVYSGVWFLRWARESVKNRMWRQLGWFSGLVCVGSVAGAVAWGAQMQSNALEYETRVAGINARQQYALLASFSRWFGVFCTLYPVEFLCFIIPKLMMLGRLTNSATRCLQAYAREQEQSEDVRVRAGALAIVYRVIAAVVMVCSVG